MSLIHWWPLNGDIEDKIGGITLTNNGATLSVAKTCQGYYFNGSANLKQNYEQTSDIKTLSAAFWIKLDTTWSEYGQVFTIGKEGNSWTDIRFGVDINGNRLAYFAVSDGSGTTSSSGPQKTLNGNVWYHIAVTYDNGKMLLYVNGESSSTNPYTTTIKPLFDGTNTVIAIGGNGTEKGECTMCDVRIYDHVLSQAEVKELSKALVMHYSFNDGFTTNICDWRTISKIGTSGWSESKSYDGECLTLTAINGWRCFMWDIGSNNVGSPITFSFEYKITDKSNAGYIYVQNMSSVGYGSELLRLNLNTTDWIKATVNISSAAQYIGFNIRGVDETGLNLTMKVKNVKIALNNFDDMYSEYNVNYEIPNDSGYNREVIPTNINVTSDTCIGTRSMKFNGAGTSTQSYVDLGDIIIDTNYMTFCVWCKWNSLQNWSRIFDFGKSTEGKDTDILLANGGTSTSLYLAGRTASGGSFPDTVVGTISTGVWYFISIVINNTAAKVYIYEEDGTLQTKEFSINDLGDSVIFTNCYLGKSNWSSDSYFDGQIADFKIYTTALSSDDIENLYRTKAYISDKGDIVCNEFVEGKSQAQVTRNGIFEANELYEEIDEEYEVLEYIENASANNLQGPTPSIDTGIIPQLPFKAVAEITTVDTAASNEDGVLLGVSSGSSFIPFYIYQGKWHSDDLGVRIGDAPNDTYFKAEYEATTSQRITTINGVQNIYNGTKTLPNASLWVMNGHWPTSQLNRGANVKLHKLTIVNAGKLERYYIPVRQKSTGNIGLYDCIYKVFYEENSGSSIPFTAGSTLTNGDASIYDNQNVSGRNLKEI